MLQDLATNLSTTLSVVSMLFFVVVYLVVAVRLYWTNASELDARAHMALDDAALSRESGRALTK